MLHTLARSVAAVEVPVLRAHGLEMWDYVVLGALEDGPLPTQGQLAARVGRDQTRMIPILDRLETDGLLRRASDPQDRRNRIVSLTAAGRSLLSDCRSSVRRLEADLLAELTAADRTTLLVTLERLTLTAVRRSGSP